MRLTGAYQYDRIKPWGWKTAPWLEGQQMALGFSSLSCTTNAKEGCPMTDADMLATVIRIISLLIAAVTIGYTIGKKK